MARRSKTKRDAFRFRIWVYILVSVCILALTGIAWIVLYSDFFKVSTIEIEPSIFYQRSDMLHDLSIEIVSNNKFIGLFNRYNIFFWYFSKGEMSHPKRLSFLKNVQIETDLARKKVSIEVNENNLKGVICKNESECYGFNEEGTVYSHAPYVEGSLIFKINDRSNRPIVIGQKFLPHDQWIDRMFQTAPILKENDLYFTAAFIEEINLKEWGVNLFSGKDILFNFEFIPEDLSQVLSNFFERSDRQDLEYVDFRVPGRIYYK